METLTKRIDTIRQNCWACFTLCFSKVRFSLVNTERRRTKERTKYAPSRRYSQRSIHPVPNQTGRLNLSFSRVIEL